MSAIANLTIIQGTTFSSDVTVTNSAGDVFSLAGHSSYAQLSKGFGDNHTRVSFSTSNNDSTGVITLTLTSQQTSALEEGRYVYDVVIVDGSSTVTRVIEGIATVFPRVSENY